MNDGWDNEGGAVKDDESPSGADAPSPLDRTAELIAVLESLADWLDEQVICDEDPDRDLRHEEHCAAVAQILELTQLLAEEHRQVVTMMNEFIGTVAMAKQEERAPAKLVIANAGDVKNLIKE